MTVTVDTTTVSLGAGCCGHELAANLHAQLSTGAYDACSVLPVPGSVDEWMAEHRTARKRVWRCMRRGYTAGTLGREHHADDIHEINTSLDHRQGRPMSAGYLERPSFSPLPAYPCGHHQIRAWGVWSPGDQLVAYLVMHRAGDLALVSQILGHGHHLDNEVMWLLFAYALEREIPLGGYVVYNRHDSGTDGLRWFKERLGFREEHVEWVL